MNRIRQRWQGQGGYREFLALAFPLILSTGAWAVQQFIDRMFLTWYSPAAIAAVMPAGMLNLTIISFFMGTASYVDAFVAQYYGAGRGHRIGPAVWQGIYVSALGGLLLVALIPLAGPIFEWVGHGPEVAIQETVYFQLLCIGSFFVIARSALAGFFAGRGRSWPIMWINFLSMAVNIFLNYVLIFGRWGLPEMGIRGAGWSTILAEATAFSAFAFLAGTKENDRKYRTRSGWKPEKELFLRLLRFGAPSGAQFFLEMVGFTIFLLLVGRLGPIDLAATNIAFNIDLLGFMPMLGAGIAITVLVGQYLGAGKTHLAQKAAYSGFHLTLAYTVVIALAFFGVPGIFLAPFRAEADPATFPEVYEITVTLLKFVALYSIFDTLNIVFASAIKGAGDTRYVMIITILVTILVMTAPIYLAIEVYGCGLITSWVIVTAYVIVLGTAFFLRFLAGKWKTMRIIEGSPTA